MVERPSTFFCLVMNVGIRENCVDDVKCKDNIRRLYLGWGCQKIQNICRIENDLKWFVALTK